MHGCVKSKPSKKSSRFIFLALADRAVACSMLKNRP
jgi:hypothetical protein